MRLSPWSHFWFEHPARYRLAAFRILFGSYLFWFAARDAARVELLYAKGGVYIPYLLPDIAPGAAVAIAIYAAWLALTLFFTLGLWTRAVTPLLLAAHLYHYGLNIAVTHSVYDRLSLLFLLYVCFGALDQVWSLRAWLARRSGRAIAAVQTGSSFASRLVQVQLAIFYLGVGLWKLVNPLWHTGDVLVFNFQGMWATPLGFWVVGLDLPSWLFDLAAWGVIVLELSLGFALFSKRARLFAAIAGAGFHTSIFLILDFPEFFVCVCAYVLFFDDATIRSVPRRVSRYTTRWRPDR